MSGSLGYLVFVNSWDIMGGYYYGKTYYTGPSLSLGRLGGMYNDFKGDYLLAAGLAIGKKDGKNKFYELHGGCLYSLGEGSFAANVFFKIGFLL